HWDWPRARCWWDCATDVAEATEGPPGPRPGKMAPGRICERESGSTGCPGAAHSFVGAGRAHEGRLPLPGARLSPPQRTQPVELERCAAGFDRSHRGDARVQSSEDGEAHARRIPPREDLRDCAAGPARVPGARARERPRP